MVLLDTTVLVDYMRRIPAAVRYVSASKGKPRASVVSLTELIAGARSQKEETAIRQLLNWITFHEVDRSIAERAGQLIKHYKSSHGIDDFDALIAATAEHHGLALATLNVKHFPMFPKLKAAY